MVADHFIVRINEHSTRTALEAVLAEFGGTIRKAIPKSNLFLVTPPELSLDAYDFTRRKLSEAGGVVKYAEPDFIVHASLTPNDPSFGLLWAFVTR